MDESSGSPDRRRVLVTAIAAAGTAALPGGSALWDQSGATDVVSDNVSEETAVVSITSDGAGGPHTSRTLRSDTGDGVDPVNRSKLPTTDDDTVDVDVEGAPRETWSGPIPASASRRDTSCSTAP